MQIYKTAEHNYGYHSLNAFFCDKVKWIRCNNVCAAFQVGNKADLRSDDNYVAEAPINIVVNV